MQIRWSIDESRMTASPDEVRTALADAVIASDWALTDRVRPGNVGSLPQECQELERVARRANDTQRLEAARFCLTELDSVSGVRPFRTVVAGIQDRLRNASAM